MLAAAQLARQVGADVDLHSTDRRLVEHVVEGRDLVHRDRRHAERLGDEVFAFLRDEAVLLLQDGQAGDHGRGLSVGRVLGDLALEALRGSLRKDRLRRRPLVHRSISPNTMSMVPMMATASAIMWPRASSSSAARCGKPGARIFSRYGLFAPSLTM